MQKAPLFPCSPVQSPVHSPVHSRTVASSLEVVRPYCVVITTTPIFVHSIVQLPHKCGTAATGLVHSPVQSSPGFTASLFSGPLSQKKRRESAHARILEGILNRELRACVDSRRFGPVLWFS